MTIESVLIANRGEIALRIIKTLKTMGIRSIQVYSEADARSPAVKAADESYFIGPPEPAKSYLNAEAIIEACRNTRATAVHPGYGFLSENEGFARALKEHGILFIGPDPETIGAMGDKIQARRIMEASGVPVVPGCNNLPDEPAAIMDIAEEIGYPLLVKATAGGGGRGMRLIHNSNELEAGLESARREALSAFANEQVFLEKFVQEPRHIEVQVFGDGQGRCIHLFERECSIQRRHQKIIEESPSPALDEATRERMYDAAIKAAVAVNYRGAGTVEFVYSQKDASFYFLEMNTRLQVEHPVTEAITGRDLVRDQILVAMDPANLPMQSEIKSSGHAMEVRLYAEDPATGFLPDAGKLHRFDTPSGIRVDSGVESGSEISLHYDPMIAKIISQGRDRTHCIEQLKDALSQTVLFGPKSNLDYLKAILLHPVFQKGQFSTSFIEKEMSGWTSGTDANDLDSAMAALAVLFYEGAGRKSVQKAAPWHPDGFQLWQG